MKHSFRETRWSMLVSRAVLLSLMWWGLSDGNAQSWWVGVPAVAFALLASMALLPPVPLVWRELPKFSLSFLRHSLQGGVDVAWRAFHPRMPITPELIDYPLRLPPGLQRVILINSVSLLPGTLSAALDGHVLKVHVLDGRGNFLSELEALEQGVSRMSGVSLTTSQGGA